MNKLKALVKRIYHMLPLSYEKKIVLKNSVYKLLSPFIKNTNMYSIWLSSVENPEKYIKNNDKKNNLDNEKDIYIDNLFKRASKISNNYVEINDIDFQLEKDDIKLLAFYLPQFHQIVENDEWWGRGFTEWTNVSKAVPQFLNHYQPHLPGELGFYDLRLKEVMKRQIELAKMYGIYGFCFYHYWFAGKRLLEKPVNMLLKDKELDIPFCLCWANENWTRRWDGLENEVLIKQNHSKEDDLKFIKDISEYFKDDRYIKIDGKPVLIIYRTELLPNPIETIELWRKYCSEIGWKDIFIIGAQTFGFEDYTKYGMDAGVEFPPHNIYNCPILNKEIDFVNTKFTGLVYDYKKLVNEKLYIKKSNKKVFKTVMPSWDNTARKPNNASIFKNSTPELYKTWLKDVIYSTKEDFLENSNFVFINAWNEWGEGTHLEPDREYGYSYLNATREAIIETRSKKSN